MDGLAKNVIAYGIMSISCTLVDHQVVHNKVTCKLRVSDECALAFQYMSWAKSVNDQSPPRYIYLHLHQIKLSVHWSMMWDIGKSKITKMEVKQPRLRQISMSIYTIVDKPLKKLYQRMNSNWSSCVLYETDLESNQCKMTQTPLLHCHYNITIFNLIYSLHSQDYLKNMLCF